MRPLVAFPEIVRDLFSINWLLWVASKVWISVSKVISYLDRCGVPIPCRSWNLTLSISGKGAADLDPSLDRTMNSGALLAISQTICRFGLKYCRLVMRFADIRDWVGLTSDVSKN